VLVVVASADVVASLVDVSAGTVPAAVAVEELVRATVPLVLAFVTLAATFPLSDPQLATTPARHSSNTQRGINRISGEPSR
jgi:hypothetical protein